MTNNHVVDGQQGLEVLLKDGTKVKAELVGTDAYTDLAVLKISADKVDTVASFGDSASLKVGEPAIAIGSPLGSQYANSVTSGIVSSLNRQGQVLMNLVKRSISTRSKQMRRSTQELWWSIS